MSLLHDLVQEMAAAGATGAHAIANVPGSLFGGGVVDSNNSKKKQRKMMRRIMNMKESLGVDLDRNEFDAADVISKIDSAGKKAEQADDTTPFGLEDEDGNMVKVYVKNDQAEDFEKQLAAMLAGEDEDDDDENSSLEIAEVLFKLKDKFDIVDVEWPGIEGDVEEEQEVDGGNVAGPEGGETGGMEQGGDQGGEMGAEGGDLGGLEGEGEPDAEGDAMAPDESGAESALAQVIDMMKSDAEAKKAEANAREAEARAKEAEYSARSGASRVKKEEQMFDMEASEKKQKEEEQEAKQMAKLARYQYDKASDAEVKLSMREGESNDAEPWRLNHDEDEDDELTLKELSYLIMRNLRHQ